MNWNEHIKSIVNESKLYIYDLVCVFGFIFLLLLLFSCLFSYTQFEMWTGE